ncbi:uncharacterized protein N0V89_001168 [Didymosphaeria variabile]|uniref:Uncharacterized protein n=1 Tax=Didymosphaeria variabile TaxID=1932322 RepID=A0A9W9CGG4_9PLEO|nr:uncharacterized protein N0V89_001168 [Didymosphaeria variabile]KAJ4360602.1 hypothetical protein N0V89_001168 [Didymosphaeria variabile]
MRRAFLPPALLLLLVDFVHAAPYDFLDNYRDPAPSPQDGPPASANATRDRNLLPAQICGIVGAYAVTVLIWGILLVTVGRKMRRRTENSPKTLELELVTKRPSLRSPTSPIGSARSVSSWRKIFRKEKDIENGDVPESPIAISPVIHSPGSFDQRIIDENKARAQAEMERLYAAVMDHDRKKSIASQASLDSNEPQAHSPRRPSAINTNMTSHSNPSSPVKAIYPPGYSNGPPTAPLPRERPTSQRSVLSKKSTSSSKRGFNLKNLRISGPIQKYPGESGDEERTPLSPRYYHNPGAPPSPPTQQNSPTTPADLEEAYEHLDTVQPLPRPAPQRHNSSNAPSPTTRGPNPTLTLSKSATSSQNELPLRGYAEPLKSPSLRTTVLNRRAEHLGMNTPKTGVPYTPYSPYMPFTPVTPVTPHLVTKKERKMAKKWDGRKQADRGDLVQSPKEIFGDAW